jgi:KUP system potassium uptake protein
MTHQAVQLGFLPSMTIRHTSSAHEGQIYVPTINALLGIACVLLVLTFRDSSRMASAYGLAVTGTMTITSLVFFEVTRTHWCWPRWKALALLFVFLSFDLPFLGANLFKFLDGGFIPVLVGLGFFVVMETWKRGRQIYAARMQAEIRDVDAFIKQCNAGAVRSRTTGVFLTGEEKGIPPVLLRLMDRLHVVPETVLLLTVRVGHRARVGSPEPSWHTLGAGVHRAIVEFGFMDRQSVPEVVAALSAHHGALADPAHVIYFAERDTFEPTSSGAMSGWHERLFAALARNARPITERLSLPPEQVIEIGARIDL